MVPAIRKEERRSNSASPDAALFPPVLQGEAADPPDALQGESARRVSQAAVRGQKNQC